MPTTHTTPKNDKQTTKNVRDVVEVGGKLLEGDRGVDALELRVLLPAPAVELDHVVRVADDVAAVPVPVLGGYCGGR